MVKVFLLVCVLFPSSNDSMWGRGTQRQFLTSITRRRTKMEKLKDWFSSVLLTIPKIHFPYKKRHTHRKEERVRGKRKGTEGREGSRSRKRRSSFKWIFFLSTHYWYEKTNLILSNPYIDFRSLTRKILLYFLNLPIL